jgi:hypothetical protein
VPFSIFMVFKKAPSLHLKNYLSFSRRITGSVLFATPLFTKP